MSGTLYKVMGKPRFVNVDTSASLAGKTVTLKSKDDAVFELSGEAASVSLKLKDILASAPDDEITLPLKKGPLGKLVEYMQYHATVPFNEIVTPLPSDNLVECGVSKWDATFVAVEKDGLFELMLGATILDIPSLFFLCGAKCAIMTKDKDAVKLRKEYQLTNDMTEDEEQEVKEKFGRPAEENSDLAALSAVLASLTSAADKQGILDTAKSEDGTAMVGFKSYKHAAWRAAALANPNLLAEAPDEVKADRDLILAAIPPSSGAALYFADPVLKIDKELVKEAVKHAGWALAAADPSLIGDRAFVTECVALDPSALGSASDSLKASKEFLLELASKGYGAAVEGASASVKEDTSFLLEAVVKDPMVLKYMSSEVKSDKSAMLSVAKVCGAALQYMLPRFQADKEVVATAVAQDPTAAIFAHTSRRVELGVGLSWDSEVSMQAELKKQPPPAILAPVTGFEEFTPQVPKEDIVKYGKTIRVQKSVQFSAMSTMTANMGQGNYIAANSWLDRITFYEKPEIDAVTLMWGAVGGIGMRWKAFASQDFLNSNPEALLSVDDARKVLHMTSCRMCEAEWYCGSFFDEYSRQGMLQPTAGMGTGGGWMPGRGEDAGAAGIPHAHGYGPVPTVTPPKSGTTGIEKKMEAKKEQPKRSDGPLGGWAALQDAGDVEAAAPEETISKEVVFDGPKVLCAGARVRLSGKSGKNGKTGVVLKHTGADSDSRWQVQLDENFGIALLKECYLEVISSPGVQDPEIEAEQLEAAARRKKEAQKEKLQRMKEKVARAMAEADARTAQKLGGEVKQDELSTDAVSEGADEESTSEEEPIVQAAM